MLVRTEGLFQALISPVLFIRMRGERYRITVSVLPKNTTQCPRPRFETQTAQSGDERTNYEATAPSQWNGWGVLPEKLGMGVRAASQSLTSVMTKICDFPYPIYDLTKNLIPCL